MTSFRTISLTIQFYFCSFYRARGAGFKVGGGGGGLKGTRRREALGGGGVRGHASAKNLNVSRLKWAGND